MRTVYAKFQDIFSRLTGLNVSFLDTNAEFIRRSSGSRRFCRMIGAIERAGLKDRVSDCWLCNFKACRRAVESRKTVIYKCHAGLTEIMVPVISEGRVIAAIVTGQVRCGGARYRPVKDRLPAGVTQDKLKAAYESAPALTRAQVRTAADALDLLANSPFRTELVQFLSKPSEPRVSTLKRVMKTAASYISKNYMDPDLSLETVASQVNLSPYYMSHIFKKAMNMTFVEYLTGKRVEEAAKLLTVNPEKNVKEIAFAVGYSDPYYFSRVFRKLYNTPPLKFRARYT